MRLRDIFVVNSKDNSSERHYPFMVVCRDIIAYCVIAIAIDIAYSGDIV